MIALVVVLAVVAVAALVGWMVTTRRHPEQAATHSEPDRHGSDRFYGNATDRPAGPDVDGQHIVGPGRVAPGPNEIR